MAKRYILSDIYLKRLYPYAAIAACAMELAPRHKEVPVTHRFFLYDLETENFFDRLNQTSITLYGIN